MTATETTTGHIRNGMGTVRPYVYGPPGLLPWLAATFAAEVLEMSPDGSEVSVRIGDSAVALSLGDAFPEGAGTKASVYVYVEDADFTYARAVANGAGPLSPPQDKPYGERQGAVRDALGNTWYIATYVGAGGGAEAG
jgi:PhnB protein